jgi:hypothetical protein
MQISRRDANAVELAIRDKIETMEQVPRALSEALETVRLHPPLAATHAAVQEARSR